MQHRDCDSFSLARSPRRQSRPSGSSQPKLRPRQQALLNREVAPRLQLLEQLGGRKAEVTTDRALAAEGRTAHADAEASTPLP